MLLSGLSMMMIVTLLNVPLPTPEARYASEYDPLPTKIPVPETSIKMLASYKAQPCISLSTIVT